MFCEKDDIKRVSNFLVDFEFVTTPFEKEFIRVQKSPDLILLIDGEREIGYCEVKSCAPDNRDFDGKDPTYNRLTKKIEEACDQFKAVNPSPTLFNVLAFVNHDPASDYWDLIGVLTGNLYAESGEAHPIYRKFSEGRIKTKKDKIHLFLWFQREQHKASMIFNESAPRIGTLFRLFGVDPKQTKQLDT